MATINLNDTTPVAPAGRQNVKWLADSNDPRNVSANVSLPFSQITWGIGIGTPVTVGTDVTPHYLLPSAGTPVSVTMTAKTAPVGKDLVCQINADGSAVLTVTLPIGQTKSSQTVPPGASQIAAGALMTLDVLQPVGPFSTLGQDVTIQLQLF